MRVEITQTRKKIIEVSEEGNIEQNILDIYNTLTDADYSVLNTEMYYNILPKTPEELGVKYDIYMLAEYIIKCAYEKYSAISHMALSVILYTLYEYYLFNKGVDLFEFDFISGSVYPKSKKIYAKYCVYAAAPIYPSSNIKSDILSEDVKIIDEFVNKYHKIAMYDIQNVLFDTLYARMVRAGEIEKPIKIKAS